MTKILKVLFSGSYVYTIKLCMWWQGDMLFMQAFQESIGARLGKILGQICSRSLSASCMQLDATEVFRYRPFQFPLNAPVQWCAQQLSSAAG